MDTRWLEDFLNLSETGNFSRSARERNVTQPAFSRRIRMLEHWAGGQLIDRSTYPTKLTQAGELFRDGITPILRDLYRLRDEVRSEAGNRSAMVVIAAMHSLSLGILPKWLNAITSDERPNIRIRSDNHHDCLQALAEGNCDFFLSYAHPDHPVLLESSRYPFLDLGSTALIPLSAPAEDGSPKYCLPGTTEKPTSFLAFGLDCYLGQVVAETLSKVKDRRSLHLNSCYVDTVSDALQALAIEGLGLAWLPEISAANSMSENRLVRAGGKSWDVSLDIRLYRGQARRSDSAEKLWSNAVAYAKGMQDQPYRSSA